MDHNELFVRSHAARDLLQSAALFKTDKLVVWEYTANGLQYVDPGVSPVVKVTLDGRNRRVVIEDNGRGMSFSDLKNFFVMHGENVDRKHGRPGRGYFGTGKSAAFGIANVLHLTTVRKGRRSQVQLKRSSVEAMTSEDPIPVEVIEREVPVSEPNGTIVEIRELYLKSLDQKGIIQYIERHLAKWPKDVTVLVNNHECEFVEPPIAWESVIEPTPQQRSVLGDVQLTIKVSKVPLEDDLRGISIFSNGVWHETTLAGSEGRDMAQYIFGEIDVPRLDTERHLIPPFDASRSMRLNLSNELVQAIYAFVGYQVEAVRRRLVEAERKRKAEEEAKRLAQQASEIAQVINDDFNDFRHRVAQVKAKARGGMDTHEVISAGDKGPDVLVYGSQLPARVVSPTGGAGGQRTGGPQGSRPGRTAPEVIPGNEEDANLGKPAGGSGSQPRGAGGFQVQFRHLGADYHRAEYARDERTIFINLDHPQLAAAQGASSTNDVVFRRLAYEVAFSEYAVALASELAARDEYLDVSDPIYDIRETLNRVARRAASLYTA